ncbi:MAG TPA: fructosamine kinase family protein [Sphingobacteriaceae bacterium]
MFLSTDLLDAIGLVLKQSQSINGPVFFDKQVAGGVNDCVRLKAGNRYFFAKINSAELFPNMFALEAEGLKLIRRSGTIAVPEVFGFGVAAGQQFLLMEWINPGNDTSQTQEQLGIQLARLHRQTAQMFGLDFDNYIGSLPQVNTLAISWTDFFISNRIQPLVEIVLSKGWIDNELVKYFDALFNKLPDFYPVEPPALLHGDLWGGNFMSTNNNPVLIDPAVYYGHREMDLAMTTLFGGFSDEFYAAYNAEFPIEKNWQNRLEIWNLYPLLVHLVLFGSSYLPQIKSTLKKYG